MLLLAACGGEDGEGGSQIGDADESADKPHDGPPPDNTISILDTFFVESFDAYETEARRLIEQDARYLLQNQTWYFDEKRNGQFDSEIETLYSTYPLKSSGVHYAHAAGLTGTGQIIAITDDGFLSGHEVFADKEIHASDGMPIAQHGTQVASVAAGDSMSMIGVAPGADLAFGNFATFETRAAAARAAERLDAVVLNNSWGFVGRPVSQMSFDSVFSGSAARDYLASLQSYAERGVVIFGMGNTSSDTQAGLMPALPTIVPELEHGWLAVINAVAQLDGEKLVSATRLSAGCLEAAAWCLAAEGSWFGASSESAESYSFATGSSFAAPMVAGAMALLGEAFPDLTPHQLRIRLLASANNEFIGFQASDEVELVPGFSRAISQEWGHGFLDVKAALLPIGRTTATLADGTLHDVSSPLFTEGGATGDAVTRALSGVRLAAHDVLDTRFALPAEAFVAHRAPASLVDDLVRMHRGVAISDCCGLANYFGATRLVSAANASTVVSMMLPDGKVGKESYGAEIGQSFQSDFGEISVSLGLGRDSGELLPQWRSGTAGSRILTGGLALTAQVSEKLDLKLGIGLGSASGGTLLNSASAGFSTPDVFQRGDTLTVTLGLPVAVARGKTTVTLPVETLSGSVIHQPIEIDFAPKDREMRLGLEYRYPLAERSEIALSAAYAKNHGNVAGRRATAAFASFNLRF